MVAHESVAVRAPKRSLRLSRLDDSGRWNGAGRAERLSADW